MKFTSKQKLRLKEETLSSRPTIWIGKKSITPELIQEVSRQLDENATVKIRLLSRACKKGERKVIPELIAKETGSNIVEVRGYTFILYKPPKWARKKNL